MTLRKKLLLTLLCVGCVGSVAGFGTWSAFTATTTNTGNSYASGTVVISQHSGATTLYNASNKGPSSGSTTACVRVTYTGSLPASVELYNSGVSNGSTFHLKVERGSGLSSPDNTMNCTGFSASSTAYDSDLASFPTTYAGGVDGKASAAAWAQNDSVDYRFTVSVNDDTTVNAHTSALSTGSHSFTWEARNN